MGVTVAAITPESPASRTRICPGDILLTVNGREIEDVLDYRFYMPDAKLRMTLSRAGKPYTVRLRKEPDEEIGLEFDTYLMDRQHSCRNQCVFCFIDQLPPGMRESLYFKDDDSRLSFLFGNYITLTNLSEHEIERIIEMHISPINVSVHTTDPELRCRMMNNRFAGESLRTLYRFAEAGLTVQCQLVLVPGYNDGEHLERTLTDLEKLAPAVRSVAAVPVGLTRYREGLTPLRPFTKEEARQVIRQMTAAGDRMLEKTGNRVFYPSDEWYVLAEWPIPDAPFYGEYAQLENGVGMVSLLREEFARALEDERETPSGTPTGARTVIATGVSAAPFLRELAAQATAAFPGLSVGVQAIRNDFFGETITVSGLVTGGDLIAQLRDVPMDRLLIPANMLRQQGDCFLDDVTPEQVREALGVPVIPVPETDGAALLAAILDI